MSYTIETQVPSIAEAEHAMRELPEVTSTVFDQLEACALDWNAFRNELATQLRNREWRDAVALMDSLSNPDAAIALARKRHDTLESRGDLTFGIVGGARAGKRYMAIREEPLLSNAQIVISSMQHHLARNHQQGNITTQGYERHLKIGKHAPFLEFENPQLFSGMFVHGSSVLPLGQDHRIVLPDLKYGAVIVLTRKSADHAAVLLTTSWCSEDQVRFAKQQGLYRDTHALIIHGQNALPVAGLQAQLKSGIAGGRGTVNVCSLPTQTFDLAIDIDHDEFIADFQNSPEWYASRIAPVSRQKAALPHSS